MSSRKYFAVGAPNLIGPSVSPSDRGLQPPWFHGSDDEEVLRGLGVVLLQGSA